MTEIPEAMVERTAAALVGAEEDGLPVGLAARAALEAAGVGELLEAAREAHIKVFGRLVHAADRREADAILRAALAKAEGRADG